MNRELSSALTVVLSATASQVGKGPVDVDVERMCEEGLSHILSAFDLFPHGLSRYVCPYRKGGFERSALCCRVARLRTRRFAAQRVR